MREDTKDKRPAQRTMRHGRGPMGGLGRPVEKPKDFKGSLKRLIRYLKPHKINLIIVLVFSIASTIFTIAAPKVSSKAMNNLQGSFMARTMLKQTSEAQIKIVSEVYKHISDAQRKILEQAALQNQQEQLNGVSPNLQTMDHAALMALQELIKLPVVDTITDPQQKKDVALKVFDVLYALPPGAVNQQEQINPDIINALKEFLGFPMLNSLNDADEKADICLKIIEMGKEMSSSTQSDLGMTDSMNNVTFSDEQISGVIKAIRETNGEYNFGYIGRIVLILIVIYIISSCFSLIMGLVMSGVSQKTVRDLRSEVDIKLNKLPLKYFDMHPHGDILSRVTNDIDTIAGTLQQSLTQIITSVITIIGYILMMLTISPILTLIVLAAMPLYIITTAMIAKRSQKYFAAQQKELGELSGHVEEMYTGHTIVKAFGHEKNSISQFEAINERLRSAGWKAQFVSGIMFPLMNFISNLGYVGISIVGGLQKEY